MTNIQCATLNLQMSLNEDTKQLTFLIPTHKPITAIKN